MTESITANRLVPWKALASFAFAAGAATSALAVTACYAFRTFLLPQDTILRTFYDFVFLLLVAQLLNGLIVGLVLQRAVSSRQRLSLIAASVLSHIAVGVVFIAAFALFGYSAPAYNPILEKSILSRILLVLLIILALLVIWGGMVPVALGFGLKIRAPRSLGRLSLSGVLGLLLGGFQGLLIYALFAVVSSLVGIAARFTQTIFHTQPNWRLINDIRTAVFFITFILVSAAIGHGYGTKLGKELGKLLEPEQINPAGE